MNNYLLILLFSATDLRKIENRDKMNQQLVESVSQSTAN